jgi:serine/threonine protein kinase
MKLIKNLLRKIYREVKNRKFYLQKRRFIYNFFKDNGFYNTKPFNLNKWHHNLYLFTAQDKLGQEVFIKLTNLPRILKNENRAYKKLKKNEFLKNHLIEHKGYIKKSGYKALILKKANGIVLNEEWACKNVSLLGTLIKIVDEFTALSLIHRDIKLDNFIYEDGQIKVFDFSFMVDMTHKNKIKEIDLTKDENLTKLRTMGVGYKPEPLKWDDYYALHVVFKDILKNNLTNNTLENRTLLEQYIRECSKKIATNSYAI